MSIASQLNRAWLQRGPLACALWPLSLLMRAVVSLRRMAYHQGWMTSVRLPVPVVVVGNRVVGGAGKTPTTMALLQHLQSQGWHPGVLSRGYKAEGTQQGRHVLIDAGSAPGLDARTVGDEPLLIWRRTGVPIVVGRDRAACGQALLKAHPDIDLLVCDDGLQHLQLQRDIEIIVFDERGAGNGWLLPAGPLREPIDAAPPPMLRGAPVVLYNAGRASTRLPGHLARRSMAPLQRLEDWWRPRPNEGGTPPPPTDRPAAWPGQANAPAIWAVAGIAQPQRFFDALREQGLQVHGVGLDDHDALSTLPWPAGVQHVVVTEKDAVKLTPQRIATERPGCQVWVAALDFRPEDAFWHALDTLLTPLAASNPGAARTTTRTPPTN
jgi:tetraacyldisaccharide 4'-kinase